MAGDERATVDDDGDVGFEGAALLVAAGDEGAECFGGEPVAVHRAVHVVGVVAAFAVGDHGGDFAVDGGEDLAGEFGVEGESAFHHAGGGVVPSGEVGVAALLEVAFHAGTELEGADGGADMTAELLGRGVHGHAEQTGVAIEQRGAGVVVEHGHRGSEGVDVFGAHLASREGLGEHRHLGQGVGPSLFAATLTGRHAPGAHVHIGCRCRAQRGGQLVQA